MAVSHVLLGKVDYGWFVDVECDTEHDGKCASDNPGCSFVNLACGEKYKACLQMAISAAKKFNVQLVNEKTDY